MSARRIPPPITLNASTRNILYDSGRRSNVPSRVLTPVSPIAPRSSSPFYGNMSDIGSSDQLLLPTPRRPGKFLPQYRDSPTSSRRSSWSAGSRFGPFSSVFDEVSPRAASLDLMGSVNSQTISEKYTFTPSAELLLFPIDKEDDDDLHDPMAKDDLRECDIFTPRGLLNVGGLAFIVLGILVLFIGYPVLYEILIVVDVDCQLLI